MAAVLKSSTIRRIAERTSTCVVTSSAVVGSSNIIRSGRGDIAMAVITRWSWPPET